MTDNTTIDLLTYHYTTHAPLLERYMPGGHFEQPGEAPDYHDFPRIDPYTGAEYKAFGGRDHKYSTDYKVGSSYPQCGFITAKSWDDGSPDHDALEAFLKEHDLWDDCLEPVVVPDHIKGGEALWFYGYQFTPVERSPRPSRFVSMVEGIDGVEYHHSGPIVEVFWPDDEPDDAQRVVTA